MATHTSNFSSRALTTNLCAFLMAAALSTGCDSASTPAAKDSAAEKGDKAATEKPAAKDDESAEEAGGEAGDPKEGGSCKGISATDGLIACEGNKVIFCSSYSNYVWTKQSDCADGTTCVAEGKSASCK